PEPQAGSRAGPGRGAGRRATAARDPRFAEALNPGTRVAAWPHASRGTFRTSGGDRRLLSSRPRPAFARSAMRLVPILLAAAIAAALPSMAAASGQGPARAMAAGAAPSAEAAPSA